MELQTIKLGDDAQRVYDTLLISEDPEVPADLSDAQVWFNYRHFASATGTRRVATIIAPATSGQVEYQWTTLDATSLGDYISDWEVEFPDHRKLRFPNEEAGYNYFRVIAPVADGLPFTPVLTFRNWVRSYLLDDHATFQQYSADQIDRAILMAVQMLRVRGIVKDIGLSGDGLSVTPAIAFDDPVYGQAWALIILHAAKRFLVGNAQATSYRTRALSETFGERREQVFELLSEVYELENGEGAL